MKKHTKIYLEGMGYDEVDFIECEVCEAPAVDIHHIDARGAGSTKKEYDVMELMAVCRTCHIDYGDKKQYKEYLRKIHKMRYDIRNNNA